MIKVSIRTFAAILSMLLLSNAATAQNGYQIRTGDTLQIEVVEDNNLNRSALVLPGGTISFPFAGNVPVAGRTTGAVASDIADRLSSNFASTPTVFVSVGQLAEQPAALAAGPFVPPTTDIYVTGEIANPGKLAGSQGITILQAIAQGGGLTRFAAGKRIQLRRGDKIYPYNYHANGGVNSIPGSTMLAPGDVIVVPQRRLFE